MRRPRPPLAALLLLLLRPEVARTDSPTHDPRHAPVAVGAESFVAALAGVRLSADGSPAAVYSVEGGGMLTRLWVTNADERVWMQVFVDGEKEPSVAFNLFAAVGVGFESGLFAGGEPFGNALFGKIEGGCYLNVHVPFSDALRITSPLEPGTPAPTQFPSNRNLCKRKTSAPWMPVETLTGYC